MPSRLLDQRPVLDGTHVATVEVKPFRLAYVVPGDRTDIVQRVIASCCLQWGGIYNLIVPATADGEIDADWLTILKVALPNAIVDAHALSDTTSARLEAAGWHVSRQDLSGSNLYINGTLLYAGLQAMASERGGRAFPASYMVADARISPEHDLYLTAIARYGLLDEEAAQQHRRVHGWAESVRLEQFIRRAEVDLSLKLDAVFGETLPLPIEARQGGTFHCTTLPKLTKAAIRVTEPSYSLSPVDVDRDIYDRGFLNTIVVTGYANSVADLALYWAIRAHRNNADPWPLWIPLDYLDSELGQSTVEAAIKIDQVFGGARRFPRPRLYIHSLSIEAIELTRRLAPRFPDAIIDATGFSEFLIQPMLPTASAHPAELYFSSGRARVPMARPIIIDSAGRGDRVAYEIQIEEIQLPNRRRDLTDYRIRGPVSATMETTGRGGIGDFANVGHWPALVSLPVPTGWNVLERTFSDRGYEIRLTPKSGIASSLWSLFERSESTPLLNSSRVYKLLQHLSGSDVTDSGQRTYVADRRTFTESDLKGVLSLPQYLAQAVVSDLIVARALLRGAELTCPTCRLIRWYPLDRLTEDWKCEGCGQTSSVPLQSGATHWHYRINELCAYALDQGLITPINAMMMLEWEARVQRRSLLGYVAAVELVALAGAIVPFEKKEIDVVAIMDGQLIVGECKEAGEHLKQGDAADFVKLGRHLSASEVIFATASSFPDEIKAAVDDGSGLVTWRDGANLMDSVGSFEEVESSAEDDGERSIEFLRRSVGG